MLDIKFILENVDLVRQNTLDRNVIADVDKVVSLYNELKKKKQSLEDMQRRSNQIAEQFKDADVAKREFLKAEVVDLKEGLATLKEEIRLLEGQYIDEMLRIPNLVAEDVPEGKRDELCTY